LLQSESGPSTSIKEKFVSLKDTWVVVALFVLVIGGIYLGIFTPTEAAGVGAFGTRVLVFVKRRLNRKNLTASLLETGKTSAMVFLFLVGAGFLGYFLALSRLPYEVLDYIAGLQTNRFLILGGILLLYISSAFPISNWA
jgi:TRAP-type C4-dicarboxylate transport system permease large subunit